MKSLLSSIISAGLGLWISTIFVAGVTVRVYPGSNFFGFPLTAQWQLFILFGIILGLLNFFVKPILDTITLPLRIITLGLFGFLINMGLIWITDYIFKELSAPYLYPLLWTTLIIWALSIIISKFLVQKEY